MPPTPERMDAARRLLDDLVGCDELALHSWEWIEPLPETAAILEADEQTRVAVVREAVDRIARMAKTLGPLRGQELRYMNLYHQKGFPWEGQLLLPKLLRKKLPFTADDLAFLINRMADLRLVCTFASPFLPQLVNVTQRWLATGSRTEELRTGLVRLGEAVGRFLNKVERAKERRLHAQLVALAGRPAPRGNSRTRRRT